jgi:hypothetical protein
LPFLLKVIGFRNLKSNLLDRIEDSGVFFKCYV